MSKLQLSIVQLASHRITASEASTNDFCRRDLSKRRDDFSSLGITELDRVRRDEYIFVAFLELIAARPACLQVMKSTVVLHSWFPPPRHHTTVCASWILDLPERQIDPLTDNLFCLRDFMLPVLLHRPSHDDQRPMSSQECLCLSGDIVPDSKLSCGSQR